MNQLVGFERKSFFADTNVLSKENGSAKDL
jgi:hypothetical protein